MKNIITAGSIGIPIGFIFILEPEIGLNFMIILGTIGIIYFILESL